MPIYEYFCEKCVKIEEVWHKASEKPEVLCSVCGTKTYRIPSVPNHKYVGYGFYATDYGAKYYCKREKDEELRKLGKLADPPETEQK